MIQPKDSKGADLLDLDECAEMTYNVIRYDKTVIFTQVGDKDKDTVKAYFYFRAAFSCTKVLDEDDWIKSFKDFKLIDMNNDMKAELEDGPICLEFLVMEDENNAPFLRIYIACGLSMFTQTSVLALTKLRLEYAAGKGEDTMLKENEIECLKDIGKIFIEESDEEGGVQAAKRGVETMSIEEKAKEKDKQAGNELTLRIL